MKKQKPFIFEISNPCHEKWEEMSVEDSGRFCSNCQKTVIDISHFDDKALLSFLSAQRSSVCLRALTSQTLRPLASPVLPKPKLYNAAAVLGFSLLLIAGADTFAKAPLCVKKSVQFEENLEPFFQSPDSLFLQGQVVDIAQKAVPNIGIKMIADSTIYKTVFSDSDGCFSVWIPKKLIEKQNLKIEIEQVAFQKLICPLTKDSIEQSNPLILTLQPAVYTAIPVRLVTETTYTQGVWINTQVAKPIKINYDSLKLYKVFYKKPAKKLKIVQKKKQ